MPESWDVKLGHNQHPTVERMKNMETKIASRKPSARLNIGATILTNAQAINTKPVKGRLDAFAAAHRGYAEAQRKVDKVEAALAIEQTRVAHLDADQDDAVEALALCLANDGQPRNNPFARFSNVGPGRLKALHFADEARAIHDLVATLLRSKSLSPTTRTAAQAAERAAQKVDAALPPLEPLRNDLKSARSFRDTIGQTWDANLTALRLAARGAAATEVPGLDTALFGRRTRSTAKAKGTPQHPAQTPSTAPSTPVSAGPSNTPTPPVA